MQESTVTDAEQPAAVWLPPQQPYVRTHVRRFLRWGKYALGDHPRYLPILLRLTPEGTSRQITADTRIVIEGFPRSGNTFAVFALRHAPDDEFHVASHVHHPSQVKLGVQRGLPTMLLVRDPIPCLASYLIAGPHGTARGVLEEYVRYHREIAPLLDEIVVATFDEVTTDYNPVLARVNERFGTDFGPFDHRTEVVDEVFAQIDKYHVRVHPRSTAHRIVPRPTEERHREREWLVERLMATELQGLRDEASAVHEQFVASIARE